MDKPYKDQYGQYRQIRWKQPVTPTKRSSGTAACSISTLRRVFQVVGEQPADPISRNFSILVPKEESSSSRKRNKNVSLRLIGLKHRKMKKFRRLLSRREPRASKFFNKFVSDAFEVAMLLFIENKDIVFIQIHLRRLYYTCRLTY